MPVTLHMYVPMHYYCGPHTDPTLLDIQVQKKKQSIISTSNIFAKCARKKYAPQMPYICHTCKLVHVQIQDNYISIYALHELKAINSVTRSPAIPTFHIIAICP